MICQCLSRRLRQIIDLRDTDNSRYFAITEFNNCFIVPSPSLSFDKYLREATIFTQECKMEKSVVSLTHEQNIICSPIKLDDITQEQTAICRQLFAGHVAGSRPMKRENNLH